MNMKKLSLLLAAAIGATCVNAETAVGTIHEDPSDIWFNYCTIQGSKCVEPNADSNEPTQVAILPKLFSGKVLKSCIKKPFDHSVYQLDFTIDKNGNANSIKSCKKLNGVILENKAS